MSHVSYVEILSNTCNLTSFSVFILLVEEPSFFIASMLRRQLSFQLAINLHSVATIEELSYALMQTNLLHTESELLWLPQMYDVITKKELELLENILRSASKEKRIFCTLTIEQYQLFSSDKGAFDYCYIDLPSTIGENEIEIFFSHTGLQLSSEKISCVIRYCLEYQVQTFDQIYLYFLLFTTVHARFSHQIKSYFEKNWLSQVSKKELLDAWISGDTKVFFYIWDALFEEHSLAFWIAFWFEIATKVMQYKFLLEQKHSSLQHVFSDKVFYYACVKHAKRIPKQALFDFLDGLYQIDIRVKDYGEAMLFEAIFLNFFLAIEKKDG